MNCPSCETEIIYDDTKFCSKCGFDVRHVIELNQHISAQTGFEHGGKSLSIGVPALILGYAALSILLVYVNRLPASSNYFYAFDRAIMISVAFALTAQFFVLYGLAKVIRTSLAEKSGIAKINQYRSKTALMFGFGETEFVNYRTNDADWFQKMHDFHIAPSSDEIEEQVAKPWNKHKLP